MVITFYSPKTAGSTIVALNAALLYQCRQAQCRVACIQLAPFPDLAQYLGHEKETLKTWGHLQPFVASQEWGTGLLDAVKIPMGVDFFPSPSQASLAEIRLTDFESIWELMAQSYDVIFVDLSRGIPLHLLAAVKKVTQRHCLVATVDRLSLQAVADVWQQDVAAQKYTQLILNQCPKDGQSFVQAQLSKLAIPLAGILPPEPDKMWSQVFEGHPVVLQKKSPWTKALEEVVDSFLT